jgi:hypothetical protein
MYVENLIFSPQRLLDRAKNVNGIYWIQDVTRINQHYDLAEEIAQDWTEQWSDSEGFGSSDFTFALKDFIDQLIVIKKQPFKTVFNPCLEIVKI